MANWTNSAGLGLEPQSGHRCSESTRMFKRLETRADSGVAHSAAFLCNSTGQR